MVGGGGGGGGGGCERCGLSKQSTSRWLVNVDARSCVLAEAEESQELKIHPVVGEEGAGPDTIHPPQKRVHNIGGEYMEEDFENDELAAAFAVKSDQLEVEFGGRPVWPRGSGRPAARETLAPPPHQGPSRSRGGAAETRRLHDCHHGIHMTIILIFPFT